jgi:hypothetical protein
MKNMKFKLWTFGARHGHLIGAALVCLALFQVTYILASGPVITHAHAAPSRTGITAISRLAAAAAPGTATPPTAKKTSPPPVASRHTTTSSPDTSGPRSKAQERWTISILSALGGLFVLYVIIVAFTREWNPFAPALGEDGHSSTSKFQFWLWTGVVIFSYGVVWVARALRGVYDPVQDIPSNLLIAMGLTVVTAVGAKGITVSYLSNGQLGKQPKGSASPSDLIQDDAGNLDLSKVQMLAWTLIAIGSYLGLLIATVNSFLLLPDAAVPANLVGLPDIAPALMVLMGLGQGAYLGQKLVTTTTPRLTKIGPSTGGDGQQITILGTGFGSTQAAGGGLITLNDTPWPGDANTWADSQITFTLPLTGPDRKLWPANKPIMIGVLSGGQTSANDLQFNLAIPRPQVTGLAPRAAAVPTMVTITGKGFGTDPIAGDGSISLNGQALAAEPLSWADDKIEFTFPATRANGDSWSQGQTVKVGVSYRGQSAEEPWTFTVN